MKFAAELGKHFACHRDAPLLDGAAVIMNTLLPLTSGNALLLVGSLENGRADTLI